MKAAGDDPEKCVAFFSRGAYYGALDAIKLHSSVGDKESITSGIVALLDGVKVVNGGYACSKDQTTTAGKIDTATPANNTKESVLIVYPDAFRGVHDTVGLRFISDWNSEKAQYRINALYDIDFAQTKVGADVVGYYYNIT
jgi:hypothetical protein